MSDGIEIKTQKAFWILRVVRIRYAFFVFHSRKTKKMLIALLWVTLAVAIASADTIIPGGYVSGASTAGQLVMTCYRVILLKET